MLFTFKNFETTTQVSFKSEETIKAPSDFMFDHLDTFPDGEGEGDEDEDEGDEGEDEVNCTPLLLLLLLLFGLFFFGLLAFAVHRRRPHFGHAPASETALGSHNPLSTYSYQSSAAQKKLASLEAML